MSKRKEETASFVLRFTQKIFENEQKEPEVQWRGNIRHVQGGEEKRFSEFNEVVEFIQSKLADLTIQAMGEKSPEEQKGILAKSFQLWKRMATAYPKIVLDTLKDPKAGVEQIQDQVSQQVSQVGELIQAKLDPDAWKPATKMDLQKVMDTMQQLTREMMDLKDKVETLGSQNEESK